MQLATENIHVRWKVIMSLDGDPETRLKLTLPSLHAIFDYFDKHQKH